MLIPFLKYSNQKVILKNMCLIIKNDFAEYSVSKSGDIVLQIWTSSSKYMSNWEFTEQIETLFSVIEVFNPKVLYIDALEFSYPIVENSIQLIRKYLKITTININTGIVISKELLGKLHILRLVNRLLLKNVARLFKTREEGEAWLNQLK